MPSPHLGAKYDMSFNSVGTGVGLGGNSGGIDVPLPAGGAGGAGDIDFTLALEHSKRGKRVCHGNPVQAVATAINTGWYEFSFSFFLFFVPTNALFGRTRIVQHN